MFKMLKNAVFLVVPALFLANCASSGAVTTVPQLDFNVFEDDAACRARFTGIWTSETISMPSRYWYVYEFGNDGTGFYSRYLNSRAAGNRVTVADRVPIWFKASDSDIIIFHHKTGSTSAFTAMYDYDFTGENAFIRDGFWPYIKIESWEAALEIVREEDL